VPVGFDLRKDVRDFPSGVDDVGAPHNPHFLLPIHHFFLPDAVGFQGLVGCIAGEREIQFVLVVKLLEFFDRVPAHPQNLHLYLIQFFFGVTELVRLAGSPGSIGLGKEIEHQRLALEILETHLITRLRWQGKIRSFVTDVKHEPLLPADTGTGSHPRLRKHAID